MFPFRRQGAKKRSKNGPGRNKPRGPQKGLPNSARELLPLLQPATKALAQMLAGRANSSGQLGHAHAVLAQAERLVAERAHNRLNPAEREEFFEQLARLKLTVADAEAEAEVVAAEEQAPKAPPPVVDQERLRQMALALAGPEPGAALARADANGEIPADEAQPFGDADEAAADPSSAGPESEAERRPEVATTPTSAANARAGRLQLSSRTTEEAAAADPKPAFLGGTRRRTTRRAAKAPAPGEDAAPDDAARQEDALAEDVSPVPEQAPRRAARRLHVVPGRTADTAPDEHAPGAGEDSGADVQAEADAGQGPTTRTLRRTRRSKNKGLPEGWVIDEDGYVVPGPG